MVVPSADFAPYEGAGNFLGNFTASSGSGSYGGTTNFANVFFGGSAVADGTVTVEYTYIAATPLPPTWTMLLAGFVGLGFLGIYRRGNNPAGIAAT